MEMKIDITKIPLKNKIVFADGDIFDAYKIIGWHKGLDACFLWFKIDDLWFASLLNMETRFDSIYYADHLGDTRDADTFDELEHLIETTMMYLFNIHGT